MEGFYKEYDCGCAITDDGLCGYDIIYCPKHKSAPDLYEALKAVASCDIDKYFLLLLRQQIKEALAKAEGGS